MTNSTNTVKGAGSALSWEAFPAGENGFFRAPILLSGQQEAILIDGGFTLSDGRALAEKIVASGKTLTTIYVSQSDPDFYFSLAPIKAAFPDARVLAASETLNAIKANVEKKLETWGPQLQDNGPQALADVVLPTAYDEATLELEGQKIDIVTAQGLENRRYLWVEDLQAIFGGVMVFSGAHVWTADTASIEARSAWLKMLDAMEARQPKVVIPGHMAADAPTGVAAIQHTRNYLVAYEEELAKAADSAALIAAMTERYPNLGMGVALQIGAKVCTGEMPWG